MYYRFPGEYFFKVESSDDLSFEEVGYRHVIEENVDVEEVEESAETTSIEEVEELREVDVLEELDEVIEVDGAVLEESEIETRGNAEEGSILEKIDQEYVEAEIVETEI